MFISQRFYKRVFDFFFFFFIQFIACEILIHVLQLIFLFELEQKKFYKKAIKAHTLVDKVFNTSSQSSWKIVQSIICKNPSYITNLYVAFKLQLLFITQRINSTANVSHLVFFMAISKSQHKHFGISIGIGSGIGIVKFLKILLEFPEAPVEQFSKIATTKIFENFQLKHLW